MRRDRHVRTRGPTHCVRRPAVRRKDLVPRLAQSPDIGRRREEADDGPDQRRPYRGAKRGPRRIRPGVCRRPAMDMIEAAVAVWRAPWAIPSAHRTVRNLALHVVWPNGQRSAGPLTIALPDVWCNACWAALSREFFAYCVSACPQDRLDLVVAQGVGDRGRRHAALVVEKRVEP